jgi:hypothetical protein
LRSRETKKEREAWSKHFGVETNKPSKYLNERTGKYASKHEAEVAGKLAALEHGGNIKNLKEQVPFTLVEGKGKIRPIKYVADFTYEEIDGSFMVIDAKGWNKNQVYQLKKKLMKLLLDIDVHEV